MKYGALIRIKVLICTMNRDRVFFALLFSALFVLAPTSRSDAQPMEKSSAHGVVTYVTSTTVYGDIGRRAGLREGDTVSVLAGGARTALLRVESLASKSFSATILARFAPILRGDSLEAVVLLVAIPPEAELLPDSLPSASIVRLPGQAEQLAQRDAAAAADEMHLRGRLSLQYYALYNSSASTAAFSQPAAVISLSAERILKLPLAFNYYSNHRYDARADNMRQGVTRDRLRNRFYQMSLRYGSESTPLSATVGRFIPHQVGGVGTVDGAMLGLRNENWEGGFLAGAQPGYQDSEINLRDQKIAVFVGYQQQGKAIRQRSSLAFAQTYRSGAVDRGYFYVVNSLGFGNHITLYQNATLDLYDADSGGDNLQPHLTDLYLSANWRPERWLSLTGSYANRRSVYFMRSFSSLPDSLFRKGRLQNYQLSSGINLMGGLYASLTGSLRTQDDNNATASSLSGRLSISDVLQSRANIHALASYGDNIYSTTTSYGLEINRDLLEGLYTALRVQLYDYLYAQGDRKVSRKTVSMDIYYRLTRSINLSLNYEHYWEGVLSNDRMYSELSFRMR